jgi:hypothetical protein
VTDVVGPFTKEELLAALDLQREKFFLVAGAARTLAPTEALARELEKGARRDLIASTHELITEYCIAGGQSAVHAAQPWYQFARVLRNSVVHYRGEFVSRWPDALRRRGVAELRWRHLVLRDRPGEVVRVTNDDALALWREGRDFAERGLR